MREPLFFYDFSSPYSYLSAYRVNHVLPIAPVWRPVVFGALIGAIGKESWSLRAGPTRDARMSECERRAAALDLPLRWPPDWPFGTYATLAVRAALIADTHGKLREFSLAAFRAGLGQGLDLRDLNVVLEAATEAGLDPDALTAGLETSVVKGRVRQVTDEAIALGVTGVPTIAFDGELFWGDDRLDDAGRAIRADGAARGAPTP